MAKEPPLDDEHMYICTFVDRREIGMGPPAQNVPGRDKTKKAGR
jgi:hypothetical protein